MTCHEYEAGGQEIWYHKDACLEWIAGANKGLEFYQACVFF